MKQLCIHDKGNQYSVYDDIGRGLQINIISFYDKGKQLTFIDGWNYYDGMHRCGKSQEDLIEFLKELASKKEVISKGKKEICLIYTDDLFLLQGFLQPILTNADFDSYIQVCNTVEIRDISRWSEDCSNEVEIAKMAKHLIDDVFIPDKYYYLTPNQQPRKYIAKNTDRELIKKLSPTSPRQYAKARLGIFSGLIFGRKRRFIYKVKDNTYMRYIDLNSAYIYALLAKKYQMEKLIKCDDLVNWHKYDEYFTFGNYRIKYKCSNIMISNFSDIYDKDLLWDNQVHSTEVTCCGTDIRTISKIYDSIEIKCTYLEYAKLDYLPENIRSVAQDEYIKKENLRGKGIAYYLQKKVVNGIPGDSTRKAWDNRFNQRILYNDLTDYERENYHDTYKNFIKSNCIYSIYWGIQLTAYVRELIYDMAIKTNAIYGDTDGMIIYKYKENLEAVEYFNNKVKEEIMQSPNIKPIMNSYNLGMFKVEEDDIDTFRWFAKKTYAYKSNGHITIKAAGMNNEAKELNYKDIFDPKLQKLNYGRVLTKEIVNETITHGSYKSIGYTLIGYKDLNDPVDVLLLQRTLINGKIKE